MRFSLQVYRNCQATNPRALVNLFPFKAPMIAVPLCVNSEDGPLFCSNVWTLSSTVAMPMTLILEQFFFERGKQTV